MFQKCIEKYNIILFILEQLEKQDQILKINFIRQILNDKIELKFHLSKIKILQNIDQNFENCR